MRRKWSKCPYNLQQKGSHHLGSTAVAHFVQLLRVRPQVTRTVPFLRTAACTLNEVHHKDAGAVGAGITETHSEQDRGCSLLGGENDLPRGRENHQG